MKKLFFILFTFFFIAEICAQVDSNLYFWNQDRSLFSNLNKDKIVSGFLEDFNFNPVPLNRLDGKTDTILDLSSIQSIYSKFEYMNISESKYRSWDSIKRIANSYTERGINPIVLFSQSYQKFKSNAIDSGLIDTLMGKIIDISPLGSTPYLTDRVFLAAPWYFSMGSNVNVKVCLPRALIIGDLTNPGMKLFLQIPGRKFELIPDSVYEINSFNIPMTPGFGSAGETWTLSAELGQNANGELMDLKNSFRIGIVESISNLPGVFWESISADISWHDQKAKGVIVYRFGKGNPDNCFRKPFIFIDGIDFGYRKDPNWSKCVDGKCNTNGFIDVYTGIEHNREKNEYNKPIPEFQHGKLFFDKLFDDGYDVIFLDFENGADYIQRNSMLLVKLIQDLNQRKCTKEEIVLCGASMGGQVARYALLYMEKKKMKHCVRNSIYFDSPHKGANIPLGLQLFVEYFANHNYGGLFDDCKDNLERKLNRPAAKQLLVHHVSSGFARGSCWEHEDFYREMKNMGDFPKFCRKVAIPSGSTIGKKLDFNDGELLFDMKVPTRLRETTSHISHIITFPFHIMHGAAEGFNIKAKFYALPGKKNDSYLIYKANGDGRGNIQSFNGNQGMLNWDNMPGGTNNGLEDLNLSKNIFGRLFYMAGSAKSHSTSFISTNSSLCLNTYDFNANVSSLIPDNEKSKLSEYPFDAFYKETENKSHVSLTILGGSSNEHQGNVGWTLWEVNRSANLLTEIPNMVSYISNFNSGVKSKYVTKFNFGDNFRGTLNTVFVNKNGELGVNMDTSSNYGFTDDFYNSVKNSTQSSIKILHTSECGAEVEIHDGGVFQLGDNNGPVNNKAEVYFRDGSYLHLYKGSKLIIHNGSKLVIEPGATLYIDAENLIQFEGPDAVLEIQGELVLKPGVNLRLTQNGFLRFANGDDGKSHVKLDIPTSSEIELSGTSNEKRLELGSNFTLEWPKNVKVSMLFSAVELGTRSSIVFNGPVDLNYTEFYGGAKSDRIMIQTPNEKDVKISGCYFGNFMTGLDISQVSNYTTLHIDKCQFDQCDVGIHTKGVSLNLKNSSFNGCKKGWWAENINYPSEIYYCHFYMNENLVDYQAEVTRASLLLSWVTATNCGLKMSQKANALSRLSVRCSNFKNCNLNLSEISLNLSSLESHSTMNGLNAMSVLHAGKNVFENSPIQLYDVWRVNLEKGMNDFVSKSGFQYIVGTIDNAGFKGTLNVDDNYIMGFKQGVNFILNYNTFGNIKTSLPVSLTGALAPSAYGGCSGTGGKDGDGLRPEFTQSNAQMPSLSCYPNPASQELTVESKGFTYQKLKVFDLNGRLVNEYFSSDNGAMVKVIDVSALPSGLYILEASDDHGVSKTLKFSISH